MSKLNYVISIWNRWGSGKRFFVCLLASKHLSVVEMEWSDIGIYYQCSNIISTPHISYNMQNYRDINFQCCENYIWRLCSISCLISKLRNATSLKFSLAYLVSILLYLIAYSVYSWLPAKVDLSHLKPDTYNVLFPVKQVLNIRQYTQKPLEILKNKLLSSSLLSNNGFLLYG